MATNFEIKRAAKVEQYLRDYPEEQNSPLARAIFKKYPKMFDNVEQVRYMIRYRRGAAGTKYIPKDKSHIRPKGYVKPNPFNIPESAKLERPPFVLPKTSNNILWLSDIHVPYHNAEAITAALTYGKKNKINTIVLGGDLLDFSKLSRFEPDPEHRDIVEEFNTAIALLKSFRKAFPDAAFYFMEGNHDERYKKWLFTKCVEIFSDPYYSLEQRLGLKELKITLIDGHTLVKAGKLNMLHGDKVIRGVFAPVNSARGAYLRAKANLIIGHTHQVSEHTEGNLNGERVSCWSTGCLCELRPKYDSFNSKHVHGFAHILVENSGDFQVKNYKIINGKLC